MNPRFVADVMLGSLSRWLRLFGFDTIYSNNFKDVELVRISLQEGRILLTRDRSLANSKSLREVLYIESEELEDQLKEVFSYLKKRNFNIQNISYRCPLCNGKIIKVSKEEIINEGPDYIFMTLDDFFMCESCKKIYWQGSHKAKIDEMRNKILRAIFD